MKDNLENKLYYGDNLTIMQNMKDESVDLIYLDPPFNSNKNYNIMYKTMTGQPVPEQVEAFCDTWSMDAEKEEIIKNMPTILGKSGVDSEFINFLNHWINALRSTQPELLAYLVYMTIRLAEMRRILKPTGSIYLHCDPTASHYIKVIMDGIFGDKNFRNEIVWKRTSAHNDAKKYGAIHDIILFYTKGNRCYWNDIYTNYTEKYIETYFKYDDGDGKKYWTENLTGAKTSNGDSGKEWRGYNPTEHGRSWSVPRKLCAKLEINGLSILERLEALYQQGYIKFTKNGTPQYKRYLEDSLGLKLQDIWQDIKSLGGLGRDKKQSLGYPTQKPITLLDRIIKASCPEEGVVFDPFCGCGTTIASAHLNNRKWIGCDIAVLSIRLIQEVLKERYSLLDTRDYITGGIPTSVEGATMLFKKDPFQFQHWAVEYVGGFCNNKKTGDKGIDGRIYIDIGNKTLHNMVISVKGGKAQPTDIRDLRGTLEREDSQLAGLICLQEPTKAMLQEAESAGFYEHNGTKYKKLQILTVEKMISDKKMFDLPNRISHKEKSNQLKLYI